MGRVQVAFSKLSIRTKLLMLVLVASGSAVLLSSVVLVVNDWRVARDSFAKQLLSLADILGANASAAVGFEDEESAGELLSSLRLQSGVEMGCIYDSSGRLFASYLRHGTPPAHPPTELGYSFGSDGQLEVAQQIFRGSEPIGVLYIRASTAAMRRQMFFSMGVATVALVLSLAAALALCARLQRQIATPIVELARAAKRISDAGDYSIRVEKTARDELGTLYDQFNAMLDQIQHTRGDLQAAHDELESRVRQRTEQLSTTNDQLTLEVNERIRAEEELEELHQQLMTVARRAGMAEIATGVLHNVGNVLNSINVSASVVADRLRGARIDQLVRAVGLLEQHGEDLGLFITVDPKGKQIPAFLSVLATHLAEERTVLLAEMDNLATKIDHVKTIITAQQCYAGASGVTETFDVGSSIDEALKLNSAAFDRHQIEIVRQYEGMPKVQLDKQKLLQILVNLIKNGKDSLLECGGCTHRQLTFCTHRGDNARLVIEVSDNGIGIAPENLTRIFSHGFTTKKGGHGFGLHSCANAAMEMGGTLAVHSAGLGQGASFTLDLPLISNNEVNV
jgi:signal transduction histidine kinase